MKKLVLLLLCVSSIATAQSTLKSKSATPIEGEDAGYSLENSPNTNWLLQSVKALEALDTTAYKSFYSPEVKFHDNQETNNFILNTVFFIAFKTNVIYVKFERVAPFLENVHQSKNMPSTDHNIIP